MLHPLEIEDQTEWTLSRLFGSTSRARILILFFGQPKQKNFQREVVFETGLSLQAVQRELGILKKEKTRFRVYYSLNYQSPLLDHLAGIIEKIS
jgi:hypothetical protein